MTKPKAEEAGTIVKDPELRAMNRIAKELSELGVSARCRLLRWINDKFSPVSDNHHSE